MAFSHVIKVADAFAVKLGKHQKKCLPCKKGKPCNVWSRLYNKAQRDSAKAWLIKDLIKE